MERDIGVFCPTRTIDLSKIVYNYQNELKGIENVTWMPSGQLLAITGFNEMVHLYFNKSENCNRKSDIF